MDHIFIPSREGDFICPRFVTTTQPSPHDPRVADGAEIIAVLSTGFLVHVRCGDLRRALGIQPEQSQKAVSA